MNFINFYTNKEKILENCKNFFLQKFLQKKQTNKQTTYG